jgi:hypothetical protein
VVLCWKPQLLLIAVMSVVIILWMWCGLAGFRLSNRSLQSLVMRYSNREGQIDFGDFICCAVRLKTMLSTYTSFVTFFFLFLLVLQYEWTLKKHKNTDVFTVAKKSRDSTYSSVVAYFFVIVVIFTVHKKTKLKTVHTVLSLRCSFCSWDFSSI